MSLEPAHGASLRFLKVSRGVPLDCAALRRKKALLLLKHQLIGGFDDRIFAIKIHEKRADSLTYLKLIANLLSINLRREILLALEIAGPIKGLLLGLPLTPREKDIQALMGSGSTNREISVDLGFSESTVRKDSVSLFAKLGVNNRKDAGDLL